MENVFEPMNFDGEVFEPMNFNGVNQSIKYYDLQRKVFNEISKRQPKYLPFVKLLKSINRKFNSKDIISYEKELKEMDDIYNYESINYATNKKIKNTVPNYKQFENLFFAILNAYKKKYKRVFVFTGLGFSDSELNFLNKHFYLLPQVKPFKRDSISKDLIIVAYNKENNFDGEEIVPTISAETTPNAPVKSNKKLYIGIGVVAVGLIAFFLLRKKK